MGVFVTPQHEIDAYYASEALGQSKAKKILTDLYSFTAEQEDISDKAHIKIGKGVDMLLTGEEQEFNDNFYVSKLEKTPSEAIIGIINGVYNKVKYAYNQYLLTIPVEGAVEVTTHDTHIIVENDSIEQVIVQSFTDFAGYLHEHEAFILEECIAAQYQSRWGAEAKIKAIVEPGSEYFKDLCNSTGKKIIDATMHNTITSVVNSLKTHPRTAKYFDKESQAEFENMDFYYQLPIYFLYNGVECKALLDLVVVIKDINGNIACVEPIDLKTMHGNTFHFPASIKTHRYDIQASWYTEAIYAHFSLDRQDESLVSPFKFIVESTTKQGKPLIFEMTREFLVDAKVGKQVSAHYYVPGIDDILRKVDYHTENGWELEQEIQEADKDMRFLQVDFHGISSGYTKYIL